MSMKVCCALAVATAVASVCSPVEAFAPHAPQASLPEELVLKENPLASSPSPELSSLSINSRKEAPLASASAAVLSTESLRSKPTSKRKKKMNPHKKMQRPVAQHSRVVQKRTTNKKNKTALLTKEEEAQYSNDIRLFRAAVKLRDHLVRFENGIYIHPTESEWAKACGTTVKNLRRLLQTGQDARTALIAGNTGLVVSIAQKHHAGLKYATEAGGGVGTILSLQDMIQEGNLGLMEAAERFEPEKGFRFGTYATWWVRQRILQSISDSSRTIRLPAHVHGQLQKIRKAKVEMKRKTGREPTNQELAHYMEISEEKLKLYTESSRNVVSLERPLSPSSSDKEDRRTLGDTLASDAPTPVEDAEVDSMRRDIRAVMETELAVTERNVLVHRFGLDGSNPHSVAETANILGISVDRVRSAEARALNKLRHPQRNYKLKEYIQHDDSSNSGADAHVLESTTDRLEETFANSPSTTQATNPDRMWFF